MSLNIVLEYEAAQRASGLVLTGEGREAEYKYTFGNWEEEDGCRSIGR